MAGTLHILTVYAAGRPIFVTSAHDKAGIEQAAKSAPAGSGNGRNRVRVWDQTSAEDTAIRGWIERSGYRL
jgi:hypothetical protein